MAVESLTYSIASLMPDRRVEASEEGEVFEVAGFECTASSTSLTARPRDRITSVEEAYERLEPHLRDWESEFDLRGLPVEFRRSTAHVVVETEIEPVRHEVTANARVGLKAEMSLTAKVAMTGPTGEFRSTPVVDYLRHRWLSATSPYQELPTSAAYALLTFIESHFGGRAAAAEKLNVSRRVLNLAGELSSRSDPKSGRKVKDPTSSITAAELGWLSSWIATVGKRFASVESGHQQPIQLTVEDLPDL